MLNQLRNLNIDRMDVDDAIALHAYGEVVVRAYTMRSIPAPEWLLDNMRVLGKEINDRHRDLLEARLKQAIAKREALKSREERKQTIEEEIDKLQTALGVGPAIGSGGTSAP